MTEVLSAPLMTINQRVEQFSRVMSSMRITNANSVELDSEIAMDDLLAMLKRMRASGETLYLVGNGGSAAVASHAVTDFMNVGKVRATTIHESSLLTCMANDYGYENAFSRIASTLARAGDILIAISSSGRSLNIINTVEAFRRAGGHIITLSGFAHDNPLRNGGDINIWLNAKDYGFVEIGHQFILHNIADRLRLGL